MASANRESRTRLSIIFYGLLSFLLLSAGPARSQSLPSFGCSSTEAESTFNSELRSGSDERTYSLRALSNPQEIAAAQAGTRSILFSKIDAAKYGFARVKFYVHDTPPAADKNTLEHTVQIFAEVAGVRSRWLEVVTKETKEEKLLADLPAPDDSEPQKRAPLVEVLPATGDRAVPLFTLTWRHSEKSQWTIDHEINLLLDLRPAAASIAAELDCMSVTAFGACGVYDARMQDSTNNQCQWDAEKNDFQCDAATSSNTGWTTRVFHEHFLLLQHKDLPPDEARDGPQNLVEFAKLVEKEPSHANVPVVLPGIGETHHLAQFGNIHLFAARGIESQLSARFFYVILQETPDVGQLPPYSFFNDQSEGNDEANNASDKKKVADSTVKLLRALPTGAPLQFDTKLLSKIGGSSIYQVLVTEGGAHSLYWLGAEEKRKSGDVSFSVLKISTDVQIYSGCNTSASEAGAASVRLLKGSKTFQAVVEVEPGHKTNPDGSLEQPPENADDTDRCPYRITLFWDPASGYFDYDEKKQKTLCRPDYAPRQLVIAKDGGISTKPFEVAGAN
jgi:hypothetical protein